MSTDNPAQQEPHDTDGAGCNGCQSDLSGLKCEAEGIAAQAAYNAETQPALLTAQSTYADARDKYREQRCLIYNEVADLKNQAKHLLERARCLIRQEHVVTCLEDAWDHVKEELETCGDTPPCCTELDCDFSSDTPLPDDKHLDALITDVAQRVDKAKACFDDLAAEPDALGQRLADLRAEIAKINAKLGDEPAKVDPKQVWAMARVAHWHAKKFWRGFDKIADYVDCLCAALSCWSKGTQALSELKREKAVRDCHRNDADQRCAALRNKTVEEILAWYDKLCPSPDCGCGPGGKGKGKEPCDDHDHHRGSTSAS
jgi:hypothetical protein